MHHGSSEVQNLVILVQNLAYQVQHVPRGGVRLVCFEVHTIYGKTGIMTLACVRLGRETMAAHAVFDSRCPKRLEDIVT
jgi:hypothetical protein